MSGQNKGKRKYFLKKNRYVFFLIVYFLCIWIIWCKYKISESKEVCLHLGNWLKKNIYRTWNCFFCTLCLCYSTYKGLNFYKKPLFNRQWVYESLITCKPIQTIKSLLLYCWGCQIFFRNLYQVLKSTSFWVSF